MDVDLARKMLLLILEETREFPLGRTSDEAESLYSIVLKVQKALVALEVVEAAPWR